MSAHLVVAPLVLPVLAAGLMLLLDERRRSLKAALGFVSIVAQGLVALTLLGAATDPATPAAVYRVGDWAAPFGITLVADRLGAAMLLLTSVLALCATLFSVPRWQRAGVHFHTLVQLLLLGLNGAFLTGDLFNLFVFFEVMLAASYGLVLHSPGIVRVRAGLKYVAFNLTASLLFLIGVSIIYAVTGTLNMADLALRIPQVGAGDRALLEAGAAILGTAFLAKAGMWPTGFWLPTTYSAAAAPVAALLAIMSKVGVYAVVRLSLLFFGDGSGESAGFGGTWLLAGGMVTLAFGAIGILASQDLGRLAGYAVLASSGTVLAALGAGYTATTSGALYYLVSSTLAVSAFFLLIELVERGRVAGADMLAVTREAFREGDAHDDEDDYTGAGPALPGTIALLGIAFIACVLILSGLPPLSGFVAKFVLLTAVLNAGGGSVPFAAWLLVALLILAGLMTLIATTRAGIRLFWSIPKREIPSVRALEGVPVAVLLALCGALTAGAGPVMEYFDAAADSLHAPYGYVERVLEQDAP